MFNIFNSNVFIEIGEAIGNVGDRVFSRRRIPELVDSLFHKRLEAAQRIKLPLDDGDVIDVPYQILNCDEEDDR